MDFQVGFNIAVLLVGMFGGWYMKSTDDRMKGLQKNNETIAAKMQEIELVVAGQYVRKDAFERMAETLFRKLDGIETKVDDMRTEFGNRLTEGETRCKLTHGGK